MLTTTRRARLTLESLERRITPVRYVVGGALTLTSAITGANANPGPDVITFQPQPPSVEISQNASSVLPTITGDTTILGLATTRVRLTRSSGSIRLLNIAAGANVSISRVDFLGGATSKAGGAIDNQGPLTLTDCTFLNNTAAGNGGAVNNAGTLRVSRCLFQGNTSQMLGGAISNDGVAELEDSTFRLNSADSGGGVNNGGDDYLTVSGCLFEANSAAAGTGGGLSGVASAEVETSTFSANLATGGGGGIAQLSPGSLLLTHVTVTLNRADSDQSNGGTGGGLFVQSGATAALLGCLIAENSAGPANAGPNDVNGTVTPNSVYNLIGATGGLAGLPNDPSNLTGTQFNPLDPKLAPLADNGGPTRTHALAVGSPALDAGPVTPGTSPAGYVLTDQRGRPRAVFFSGDTSRRPDIGAFEAQAWISQPVGIITQIGVPITIPVPKGPDGAVVVTASSSNHTLLSSGNVVHSGNNLNVIPSPDQHGTAKVTLTATNPTYGDRMSATFEVTVTGVTLADVQVPENAAVNTLAGTLASTVAGFGSVSYALGNSANGAFKVSGNQILVADTSKLDYEVGINRVINVQVLLNGALQFSRDFTVLLRNVAERPAQAFPAARQHVAKNGAYVFEGATRLSLTSVDAGALVLQTTLSVTSGRLFVRFPAGVTVIGQNTGTVILIGTRLAINTAINQLTYRPAMNFVGKARLDMTTVDKISGLFVANSVFFDIA